MDSFDLKFQLLLDFTVHQPSHMNPDIAVWKQMSGSGIHVACCFWCTVESIEYPTAGKLEVLR